MNDEQITTLARECAEWMLTDATCDELPNCLFKTVLSSNMECVKEVIGWLLQRFYLVEKSKLTKMYKEAVDGKCELEKMRPQNTYAKNSILMKAGMNAGCAYTLKSLFPDLGKEVES